MRLTWPGRAAARLTGGVALLLLGAGLWLALGGTPPVRPPPPIPPARAATPTAPPPALPSATSPPPASPTAPPAPADSPTPPRAPDSPTPPPPPADSPTPPPPPSPTEVPPAATATPAAAAAPVLPSPTLGYIVRVAHPTPIPHPPPSVAQLRSPTPRPPVAARPAGVSTPAAPHPVTVYAPGVRFGDPRPPDPGRIVHISSPNVRLNTDAIEVYVQKGLWQVADYAAGHHWGTANPGQGGNIVVTGHNNWRGEVFRYLEFLQPGNEIDVTTADGRQWRYIVTEMQKLPEKNASLAAHEEHAHVMDPTPFERLTLITCWPYTTYTHRLIIYAMPAS